MNINVQQAILNASNNSSLYKKRFVATSQRCHHSFQFCFNEMSCPAECNLLIKCVAIDVIIAPKANGDSCYI